MPTVFHNFLQGEEDDREDDWYNDEEDSRTRRQKAQKIQATVPVTYNHSQHNVSGTVRILITDMSDIQMVES